MENGFLQEVYWFEIVSENLLLSNTQRLRSGFMTILMRTQFSKCIEMTWTKFNICTMSCEDRRNRFFWIKVLFVRLVPQLSWFSINPIESSENLYSIVKVYIQTEPISHWSVGCNTFFILERQKKDYDMAHDVRLS